MTLLLPLIGPEAIELHKLPKAEKSVQPGTRALGVQTAELARQLSLFVREQGWNQYLQVVVSHRGLYQGERKAELLASGILLRQIAFFVGNDHSLTSKAGVSDIAVVTCTEPRQSVLLIEIEEDASGTKPKTVIGDALLPMLADRMDVLQGDATYSSISLEEAAVWVGYHPRPGYDVSRTDRLADKLNDLLQRARVENGRVRGAIRLFNEPPERLYGTLLVNAQRLLREWTSRQANGPRGT